MNFFFSFLFLFQAETVPPLLCQQLFSCGSEPQYHSFLASNGSGDSLVYLPPCVGLVSEVEQENGVGLKEAE